MDLMNYIMLYLTFGALLGILVTKTITKDEYKQYQHIPNIDIAVFILSVVLWLPILLNSVFTKIKTILITNIKK